MLEFGHKTHDILQNKGTDNYNPVMKNDVERGSKAVMTTKKYEKWAQILSFYGAGILESRPLIE